MKGRVSRKRRPEVEGPKNVLRCSLPNQKLPCKFQIFTNRGSEELVTSSTITIKPVKRSPEVGTETSIYRPKV